MSDKNANFINNEEARAEEKEQRGKEMTGEQNREQEVEYNETTGDNERKLKLKMIVKAGSQLLATQRLIFCQ